MKLLVYHLQICLQYVIIQNNAIEKKFKNKFKEIYGQNKNL